MAVSCTNSRQGHYFQFTLETTLGNTYVKEMTYFCAAGHQSVNFNSTPIFLIQCQSLMDNATALKVIFLKSARKTVYLGKCLAILLLIYGMLYCIALA